ncbi:MAG: hypothetical protein PVG06_21600 [Desulfobacterales bacterium]|jgi:hypothetical protein
MDINAYCNTLEKQFADWRAKLADVIHIVDELPEGEKEAVYPSIRGLHSIMAEIDSEVELLKTACPPDWSPNRQTIDAKMAELQQTLKNLSKNIGGPVIPDSLAWVSK